ncbi:hypothetical protein PF008_g21430 [Phytophthora fragariae]|uniref:Uncharacterized protein n=1 Tax=Phytophthora fragariae TaxID=53985 RepID=A0A6G0QWW1_9STRA|nr:hypothetical protein PF008_g21430 [Phytophthora fragariae]
MDDVPMEIVQPASFPVTTLPGSPPSRQVLLKDLPQRVKKRAPECVVFCETLLGLLKAVHDAVLAHDDQWRVVFCDLVKRFLKMLGHKPLLKRLADGEVIAYTFREFNARVGDIFVGVGLNVERNLWAAEWERGCDYQATKLRELVSAAAPRMLIGEMRDVDQVTTAMLGMYSRLEGGTCGNLDALKRETLERLLRKLGLETWVITSETVTAVQQHPTSILSIFRWFIPERDAPPFKMDLEEDIVKNVIAGNPYERPEEASDEEWGVISRLIAVNIEDRPDTQEAIALIRCLVPAAEKTPAAA